MKKTTLLAVLLNSALLFTTNSFAQSPAIEWQKSIGGTDGDAGNSIFQTNDGGYVIAGNTKSIDGNISGHHGSAGTDDFLIVKLDKNGTIEWLKSLGGSAMDNATSIQQTTDGGYIVTGLSMSNDGDVTGNHGSLDCWVVKLTNNGNIDWQKSFGGSGVDYGVSLKQTNDGYIIASTSYSLDGDINNHHGTSTTTDVWVVKLNNTGDIQWQKSYGGTGNDFVASIGLCTDGGFIVSGKSNSIDGDVTGNHGLADCWVIKMDNLGTMQWQKSFGGTADDGALSIQQTKDDGYVIAGTSASIDGDVTGHHGTSSNTDYWVVKLNSNGDLDWQKSFGGTSNDGGTGIWQTNDGGYFVSGHSYSNDGDVTGHNGSTTTADIWVLKLTNDGNIAWQKSLGGTSDELNAVFANQETSDGGYVIAGTSRSTDGDITGHNGTNAKADCWVVKLEGNATAGNITTINKNSSLIFPNPNNGIFQVKAEQTINSIHVYDQYGRLLETRLNPSAMQTNFDLSNEAKGLYFLKVTTDKGVKVLEISVGN